MDHRIKRTMKANPVPIDRLIGPVIKDMGIEPHIALETIQNNWKTIVGTTNAKNTKPSFLRHGKLTIEVSSPVWMTQARFYKSKIIEKINSFGNLNGYEIGEVVFKLERFS